MFETKHISMYPNEVIVADEVGRGPLSGPVVIGALRVCVSDAKALAGLLRTLRARGVRDSKALSGEERLQLLDKLGVTDLPFRRPGTIEVRGLRLDYVTWDMDHQRIDEMNILAASLEGMKLAAQAISDPKALATTLFIDGPHALRWDTPAPTSWTEVPVVKGDAKSALIGLASIIAKEKRDRYMREMHELYPHYGFAAHFGYPTKEHRRAIQEFGPSPIHRTTFKGVREFLRP